MGGVWPCAKHAAEAGAHSKARTGVLYAPDWRWRRRMPERGIPIGKWSGSDATRELHQTIKTFNAETSRQTRTLIRLTWIIAALTFVMAIEVAWQLWKGGA